MPSYAKHLCYINRELNDIGIPFVDFELWQHINELNKQHKFTSHKKQCGIEAPHERVINPLRSPVKKQFQLSIRLIKLRKSPAEKYAIEAIARIRKRALSRGWDFDLDIEWVMQKRAAGRCEITGVEFDFSNHTGPWYPTVDRKNSDLGYTKNNCHMVVWMYNRGKNINTHEEMMILAKRLIEFNKD